VTHKRGAKLEPHLRLDMSFDEALSRFTDTDPKELDESIERAKTKRPPQNQRLRRSVRPKSSTTAD
jgi:hypothetical protein